MPNGYRKYGSFDIFKLIASILVISVHTGPLLVFDSTANTILSGIIARIAVPFFLMVTGFFTLNTNNETDEKLKRTLKKLMISYFIATIIYIPINIYASNISGNPLDILRSIIFDGTFYHLWYFPATIIGLLITSKLIRKFNIKIALLVSVLLYIVGLLGDSYYGLISNNELLNSIYMNMFNIFSYTRNGLFYAPIFLVMGAYMNKNDVLGKRENLMYFIVFLVFMIFEGLLLDYMKWTRHDSMYLFLIFTMYFIFAYLKNLNINSKILLRRMSTIVYVIHPLVIIFIRGIASLLKLNYMLVDNTFILFILCVTLSIIISYILAKLMLSKRNKDNRGRAWIEVSSKALANNIDEIRKIMDDNAELMAVLKADAYGHGSVLVAKECNKNGIKSFCVATLDEGIELRKARIKGDILILGYTSDTYYNELIRYNLMQTVVDINHATKLNSYGRKIKVHLAIDTGMNRIGINHKEIEVINKVINMSNLDVCGIFTHLSCSDSKNMNDISFTFSQIESFSNCVRQLSIRDVKIHILASSGLINYPLKNMDYARVGLALFGPFLNVINNKELDLLPVLSLKARIATIKYLNEGDKVGYGQEFTAKSKMKIATITIGYSDGLPRCLSKSNGAVLYKGQPCSIIGRICMDQCMIDITNIAKINIFDEVVIIGKSLLSEITVNKIAMQCNTIPCEILTQFQKRLPRILVD